MRSCSPPHRGAVTLQRRSLFAADSRRKKNNAFGKADRKCDIEAYLTDLAATRLPAITGRAVRDIMVDCADIDVSVLGVLVVRGVVGMPALTSCLFRGAE